MDNISISPSREAKEKLGEDLAELLVKKACEMAVNAEETKDKDKADEDLVEILKALKDRYGIMFLDNIIGSYNVISSYHKNTYNIKGTITVSI